MKEFKLSLGDATAERQQREFRRRLRAIKVDVYDLLSGGVERDEEIVFIVEGARYLVPGYVVTNAIDAWENFDRMVDPKVGPPPVVVTLDQCELLEPGDNSLGQH